MTVVTLTPAEVMSKTAIQVTETHVAQARFVLESVAGLDLSVDVVKGSDQRAIKNAWVWQSAYMAENPLAGVGNQYVTSVSVNGVSQSFTQTWTAEDGGPFLAPLAARCLKGLSSNKRVRTIHSTPEKLSHADYDEEGYDWRPLPGVWQYR